MGTFTGGGCINWRGSIWAGFHPAGCIGGVHPGCPPPVNRMTDACDNITSPHITRVHSQMAEKVSLLFTSRISIQSVLHDHVDVNLVSLKLEA